jgi:hypothetical protein
MTSLDQRLEQARLDAGAATPDRQQDPKSWHVRNLTAEPIELTGRDEPTHVVPAFGSLKLEGDPRTAFDKVDALRAGNAIEVTPDPTSRQTALLVVLGLEFWLVPIFIVVALIWGDRSWWLVGACLLIAIPVLVGLLSDADARRTVWEALQGAPRRAMNLASLTLVLLFAVAVPAVTIYLGADLHDVVERASSGPVTDGGTDDLTLLARGMQFLFIAAASMLPGLLYYQFDRERLGTIWEKFTRHVFRLDPRVTTEPALLAKYGYLMDEVFGRRRATHRGRLLPGKLSPIVVATLVMVLGWLITLLNPQVGAISTQDDLVALFQPHESAVTFAFLGAYVYALGALLRGYVRRDLRPKSYTDITIRILTVVALAWLLQAFVPDDAPALLVFAFATGLVPQTAFTLLREAVQGSGGTGAGSGLTGRMKRLWQTGRKTEAGDDTKPHTRSKSSDELPLPELDDPLPLTNLEGIDLYDRARLASEGITNIEALAHSDLIELMVQTRIPAPRLVDWVDQSILYLHVPRSDSVSYGHADAADHLASYDVLRRYGIRSATDLICASRKAQKDPEGGESENALLNILGPAQDLGPPRLSVILHAIEDEEWVPCLLYWRSHDDPGNVEAQTPSSSTRADSASPS